MEKKYGRSTLAAMAFHNTKAANNAKASVNSFKNSVYRALKVADKRLSDIHTLETLNDIECIRKSSSTVLMALQTYSEELDRTKAPYKLYDSLLQEFKENLAKIDDLHTRITLEKAEDTYSDEPETTADMPSGSNLEHSMQVTPAPGGVDYSQESSIFDERSQQIQNIRSDVYGIHDLYLQIGDIVEYQGEQIDSIENNMYTAYEYSRDAVVNLGEIDSRSTIPRSTFYIFGTLVFCLTVLFIIYRKL